MSSDRTSAPPIQIAEPELHECSCIKCRRIVWAWEQLRLATGGIGCFDRERVAGGSESLLSLHGCHYDLSPEDLDDPDWGWVED
jgi:hypothetical protein